MKMPTRCCGGGAPTPSRITHCKLLLGVQTTRIGTRPFWSRFCDHTTSLRPEERREGASPSFEFKCDKTGFAGSRGARADSVRPLRPSYMHPDAAVKGLFVVSIIAAVALLAYFRVPLGGCGASSALDDFAPPKRKKRVKHAD